jgi:hypothetical protein
MWKNLGTIVLIIVGGFATYLSWWLLFNLSDPRMKRLIRPRWTPPMSRQDYKAYREANFAFVAIALMIIGTILLMAGVLRAFGY